VLAATTSKAIIDPPVSKKGADTLSRIADPKAKITLLRAAEAVFAEKGLAGAKVEEITRRAGLSKGAFYLHFESKEAALKHVVESFLARLGSFIAAPSDYPEVPTEPHELLDFCFERDMRIYEFLWENRAIIAILQSCQGGCDYLVDAFRAEIDQRTREWIEQWRRDGIFREEIDPDIATILMSGAYHELTIRMLRSERRPPLEAWIEMAQDTFVRAYGSAALIRAQDERNRGVNMGIVASRRDARRTGRSVERGRG
jgi:AcrR family transcriptional regulator